LSREVIDVNQTNHNFTTFFSGFLDLEKSSKLEIIGY
jgi:hypothetical protein